jgi:hypothetical protein
MELIVNGEKLSGRVSNRQIEESIRSLTGDGDSFAILARAEQEYIQTSGDPSHGFVLEYRDGSDEKHYSCSNFELSAEQIIRAFQSYLAADDRWKSELEWQSQEFNYSGSASVGKKAAVVIGLVVVAAIAWAFFVAN